MSIFCLLFEYCLSTHRTSAPGEPRMSIRCPRRVYTLSNFCSLYVQSVRVSKKAQKLMPKALDFSQRLACLHTCPTYRILSSLCGIVVNLHLFRSLESKSTN